MSKFNKCSLAAAVVVALALPVSAIAASAGYPTGSNNTFASNLFGDDTATITNPAAYSITTDASDNIIGRTTGFGIRLTLGNGVQFGTVTAPSAGTALTDYAAPVVGANSGNVLVISVTPSNDPTDSPNVGTGTLVSFGAGDIQLTDLEALAAGGSVPVTIELFDSNTAQVFETIQGQVLANSTEGTTVVFNPEAGDVNKRIDVASCAAAGVDPAVGPKRRFSDDGEIGTSCTAADTDRLQFNAGSITLGITQVGTTPEPVRANGFTGANSVGNAFVYAPGDDVIVTLTGADLGAFDDIYLSVDASCDAGIASGTGTGNSRTFSTTAANWGPTMGGAVTGGTRFVCASVDGSEELIAQTFNATVEIDFDDVDVIDPANRSGNLLPLQFNGTVLEFQNVNPGNNPRAQSFMRFTNNSTIACPVTLVGRDDNGAAGDSGVAFTLPIGASQTFNSEDLENGSIKGTGAFGDGVGRWYVTANAECGSFVGSALNRNLEDGTVTNLTPDKRVSN